MTFLPIVVRELRVAARRKSTFRARFWTAFTAIAFGSYLVCVSDMMGKGAGTFVFNILIGMCFVSCLSLVRNTNDSISEEKREGTLGLLFLTDLKGHDIALGKLCSGSLMSFYSLLGIFPIVAVSMLLGGISAIEFWEVALALLNVFFFSQSAGILVSTLSRKRRAATSGAAALLLAYTAGFYFLSLGLHAKGFGTWISIFEWLNPAYCVHWACTMGINPAGAFARKFGHYWTSLLLVHLNAWLFLALASWRLPHCWQDKPARTNAGWRERLRRWYHARHTPRGLLLDRNPFLWLTIRNRLGSLKVWSFLAAVGCLLGWLLHRFTFKDSALPLFCMAIGVNHLLLKIFVASEAGGNMEEQRRSGALELLLSCTPLQVEEIVAGQWMALRRQLLWPTISVLVSDFTMMFAVVSRAMPEFDRDDKLNFVMYVLAVVVMLVPDMITLGWVGMWNGMSHRKLRHASGATIAQVLFLPWVFLVLTMTVIGVSRIHVNLSFGGALAFWFIVGIATDVFAGLLASQKLLAQFRARAAVHGEEAIGLFGRLGRLLGELSQSKPPVIKN